MHARSKTFQLAPEKLNAATDEFKKDHLHKFRHQKGYKGFTLLANRKSGKVTGVSFWDTESDVAASEELGRAAGEAMQKTGGGTGAIAGDNWEVLVDDTA